MLGRVLVLVLFLILAVPALAAARPAVEPSTAPARLFIPHISRDVCGDFFDDFSTATGWFTGERDGLRAELADGEYRLLITRPGHVWMVGSPDCARHPYRAEVDARWAGRPGNFYGLLFAIDGQLDQSYLLAVDSADGVWLVFRITPDSMVTVVEPTANDAIHPGNQVNRLAVAPAGGRVLFSINGSIVGQLPDPRPGTAQGVGLVAASSIHHAPADARFDNFTHQGLAAGAWRAARGEGQGMGDALLKPGLAGAGE